MTNIVGALLWQDSADYGGPVAPTIVDPAIDGDWIFAALDTQFGGKNVKPRFVQIDNFANAQIITVLVGKNISYQVNQYSRTTLPLPPSVNAVEIVFSSIVSFRAPITATFSIPDIHWADSVNIYAIQQAVKTGGLLKIINQKNGNYPLAATDLSAVFLFTAGIVLTATLPDATGATIGNGWNAEIWNSSASAANVSVVTQGGQTIDGGGALTLLPGQRVTLISDGANWQTDVINPALGVAAGTLAGQLAYFTGADGRQLGKIATGALGTALLGQGVGVPPAFGAFVANPLMPITTKVASYNMANGDVGATIVFNSGSAVALNLVATSAIANGAMIAVKNFGAGVLTINRNGTDTIISGASNLTALVLQQGDAGYLIPNSVGQWVWVGVRTFTSAQQTITAAGGLTIAHNLGIKPLLAAVYLQCTTADNGYAIGDMVLMHTYGFGSTVSLGVSVWPDVTNINCRYGSNATVFTGLGKTTGTLGNMTGANWRLVLWAGMLN